MTQEEFIEILKGKRYSYKIEGDRIIVTHKGNVNLDSLWELPVGVEFKNGGDVYLSSLKLFPVGVVFNNGGYVDLRSLEVLTAGVRFENGRSVDLLLLKVIPVGVVFNNKGNVYLGSLTVGLDDWNGNIKGIDSKRLLNLMIKKGMFL